MCSGKSSPRTHFYPRPPRGGRQAGAVASKPKGVFLSTPSARRATTWRWCAVHRQLISIHALREEGDPCPCFFHVGSFPFLSTPSARRATMCLATSFSLSSYFYPRPPRGGRPRKCAGMERVRYFYPRPPRGGRHNGGSCRDFSHWISIHALREEGDLMRPLFCSPGGKFLSTPSARRATSRNPAFIWQVGDFYPRPPRGGRPPHGAHRGMVILFLSTPSARRATTLSRTLRTASSRFLSTPSARRATKSVRRLSLLPAYFYPRPPRGGRQTMPHAITSQNAFLSTPSARRATFGYPV